MDRAIGVITLVQEQRFKLVDGNGRTSLFILARNAPLETAQLSWLQQRQMEVEVTYAPVRNLIAAVAYDVMPRRRRRRANQMRSGR